jgi:tungstate transport system substrate-binding protein
MVEQTNFESFELNQKLTSRKTGVMEETPSPSIVKRRRIMRKALSIFLVLLLLLLPACAKAAPKNPVVRLSTTTSVNDSGLLPELEKLFEQKSGYQLEIVANGTGAAIKLGESGDADVLLVHAKASEDAFVSAGFGIKRIPFMHNYFIIAGPESDPAKIKASKTAAEAFKAIEAAKAPFVSRGDDSGTHKAELAIWTQAGIKPTGSWYNAAGKGMGPCLQMAGEMSAYILTDQATFLATKSQTKLAIILGQSNDLLNTYSLIAVNPEKSNGVNAAGATAFIKFMLGNEAKPVIAEYGKVKYGEPLFLYDGGTP